MAYTGQSMDRTARDRACFLSFEQRIDHRFVLRITSSRKPADRAKLVVWLISKGTAIARPLCGSFFLGLGMVLILCIEGVIL